MLTDINVEKMNEIVWTDDLVYSMWNDDEDDDGDHHPYPVDRLRMQEAGNKLRECCCVP